MPRRRRSVNASCPTIVRRPPAQTSMAAQRSMEMAVHRPIAPQTAHAIGRLREIPPTVVALRRGSVAGRRTARRMAPAQPDPLRAPIVRLMRALVRGPCPTARARVRVHPTMATTGHPRAIALTSLNRARRFRRTPTAIVRRIRTAAVAPMSCPPARTPRPAAAIRLRRARTLRLRVRTRRRAAVTLHRARVTPHLPGRTPLRAALTPGLAVVMAAEVVTAAVVAEARIVVEEAATAAVVAEARTVAAEAVTAAVVEEAVLAAVVEARAEAVLTGTKLLQLTPAPNFGAGFFCVLRVLRDGSARNSLAKQVFSTVRDFRPFLIGHRGKPRCNQSPDAVHTLSIDTQAPGSNQEERSAVREE